MKTPFAEILRFHLAPTYTPKLSGVLPLLLALPLAVQAQFDYTRTRDGGVTITRYTGSGGDVTIPGSIDGFPVIIIGVNAFSGCRTVTSVTIPGSVTRISAQAFDSCTSLTSITIPSSVTNIDNPPMPNCIRLAAITVDALNPAYSGFEGVLFDKGRATLIQCPAGKAGDYKVPDTVATIGNGAFAGCRGLTNISLGGVKAAQSAPPCGGVTTIGEWAFQLCNGLTCVTIPESVTNLGRGAFYVCAGLASVTIPNSITNIPAWTFFGCGSLTNVSIAKTSRSIGRYAFGSCTRLTEITLPDSVTSIDEDAFSSCTNLTKVTVGSSLRIIGDEAFGWCYSLAGIYFKGNAPDLGGESVFISDDNATVFYLAGTSGWGTSFGGRPTALWLPQMVAGDVTNGVQPVGFTIKWAGGISVVVSRCVDLMNPTWVPISTNTLPDSGSAYFSDPGSTNYPARFYRLGLER